jgi:hypothetical protein
MRTWHWTYAAELPVLVDGQERLRTVTCSGTVHAESWAEARGVAIDSIWGDYPGAPFNARDLLVWTTQPKPKEAR